MKRTLSSLLVIAMMLACATSAFAAPPTHPADISQATATVVGEPIGTRAEEDGILLESRASAANGLPFTMTANGVTNLLTTYASTGKNFTGGVFDGYAGEGLRIVGKITHTLGENAKVGACYYNTTNDTFYTVKTVYFRSGVNNESAFIPKLRSDGYLYFNNSITYYGHITNHTGSGSVSGTLNFSVSTNPN